MQKLKVSALRRYAGSESGRAWLCLLIVLGTASCGTGSSGTDVHDVAPSGRDGTGLDFHTQRDATLDQATHLDSAGDLDGITDSSEPDLCVSDCVGKVCGPDGCSGDCGQCRAGHACQDGQCICVPDCADKTCGPDGCGGQCGSCDDYDVCTDDWCDDGACQHSFNYVPCDDGNPCTGNDNCHAGVCSGMTLPQVELVEIGCVCHGDTDCQPLDDGDLCNGTLYCNTENKEAVCAVVPGSIPNCDDGNPCTLDICEPYLGCSSEPDDSLSCSNGDPCDGKETCDNGECFAGAELVCTDGDSCTKDACVPMTGCVYEPDPEFCEDGLECTTHTCQDNVCDTTLLPGFCIIDKLCMEPGYQNPVNLCQVCLPDESNDSWTYLDEGASCDLDKVCHGNKCCQPDCNGLLCGPDGCGGSCGTCPDGWSCQAGGCVEGPCVADCQGKECGSDGCQGSCGECPVPLVCDEGICKKIEPYHIWSKRFGGNGPVEGTALAVGPDGSVVVAGRFDADVVDFGCSPLEKQLHNDLFIVKFAADGTCIWSRAHATGLASHPSVATDVDEMGNTYLAGSFTMSVFHLGDMQHLNSGNCCIGWDGGEASECNDVFLAKLDAEGQYLWSKSFGGCDTETVLNVERTVDGYLTVRTYSSSSGVDYGGGPLDESDSGLKQHISRFDQEGNHEWSISLGAGGWFGFGVGGLSCDKSGACVFVGSFNQPVELDGSLLFPKGYPDECILAGACYDGLVGKVNQSGHLVWANSFGGVGWEIFSDVEVGPYGGGLAVANFKYAESQIDGQTFEQQGDSDLLAISFGSSGSVDWIVHGTGPHNASNLSVATGTGGGHYVGATFKGALGLSTGISDDVVFGIDQESADVALFRLSPQGVVEWGAAYGGVGTDEISGIEVLGNEYVYLLGGATSISLDFGGPELQSIAQSYDTVVARLGQIVVAP